MPAKNLSDTTPAAPSGNINIKWQIDTASGFTSAYVPSIAPGAGTVTSVGLAAPAEFTVTGSPVTTNGTLTFTKAVQAANLFYAGPASGASAAPVFRALTTADMPAGIVPAAPVVREVPTGTMDGSNKNFTLSYTPNTGTLMLYLNGVEQDPTVWYTISGNTITYTVAPKATDQHLVKYNH